MCCQHSFGDVKYSHQLPFFLPILGRKWVLDSDQSSIFSAGDEISMRDLQRERFDGPQPGGVFLSNGKYGIIISISMSQSQPRVVIMNTYTSASVKSYQLVKVVSGGHAPGKSSSLASPQLLVIERFLRFGAVRMEKVQFLYCVDF